MDWWVHWVEMAGSQLAQRSVQKDISWKKWCIQEGQGCRGGLTGGEKESEREKGRYEESSGWGGGERRLLCRWSGDVRNVLKWEREMMERKMRMGSVWRRLSGQQEGRVAAMEKRLGKHVFVFLFFGFYLAFIKAWSLKFQDKFVLLCCNIVRGMKWGGGLSQGTERCRQRGPSVFPQRRSDSYGKPGAQQHYASRDDLYYLNCLLNESLYYDKQGK